MFDSGTFDNVELVDGITADDSSRAVDVVLVTNSGSFGPNKHPETRLLNCCSVDIPFVNISANCYLVPI